MKISKEQSIYPTHLISQHTLSDGTVITIRPARLDDSDIIQDFIRHLSSELQHLNYMENFKDLPASMLQTLTQVDYKRTMIVIATYRVNEKENVIGLVHYRTEPDGTSCEFDMIVADAWQNRGVGTQLTKAFIKAAVESGLKSIKIIILASNISGLALARRYGFVVSNSDDPTVKIVTKNL